MDTEIEKRKDHYLKNFRPSDFYETITSFFHCGLGVVHFYLKSLHELIQSGRFEGSKLLDIGSGPTVHNMASASACFPNIVLSEFVPENRQELQMWLDGKSKLDWSPFLDYVAELEGHGNDLPQARYTIESRIRKSVKSVVPSDLLTESVFDPRCPMTSETSPPYDLIISSLCIFVVAGNFDEYVAILKRIGRLLRKGGGLVICELINECRWYCGGREYHTLKMFEADYVSAFDKAGFGNLEMKLHNRLDAYFPTKFDKAIFIAAEKL